MEPWKRNLWILWVGVLLCNSSYTMSIPFLPLFLFDLGVGEKLVNIWAGTVYSSAFLMGAIMAPFWGSLADKYGKRKMVIRAGFSLTVTYFLFSLVHNPWELVAARMLQGFVGGFVPASMAIVSSTTPEQEIGPSLGLMQAGAITGGIMGPLFGGILAEIFGIRQSFVAASALMFLATLAVYFWVYEEKSTNTSPTSGRILDDFKTAFHNRTLMQMLCLLFIFQVSINIIQPQLTLHIAHLSGQLKGAVLSSGIIFSLIGVAGIIASPFWGRIGLARGYLKIMYLCLLAAGLLAMCQLFTARLWSFTAVQFIYGLFMAGVIPSINTLVVQHTDRSFRGRSFGLTTSANQFGAMIGPMIGGAVGLFLGIQWVFVVTGFILVSTGITVWRLSARKKDPSSELLI
jgi:DHA1 family multidrug resistance protein-like MFS transporter